MSSKIVFVDLICYYVLSQTSLDLILGEEHFLQHLGRWWVHLDGAFGGSGRAARNGKGSAREGGRVRTVKLLVWRVYNMTLHLKLIQEPLLFVLGGPLIKVVYRRSRHYLSQKKNEQNVINTKEQLVFLPSVQHESSHSHVHFARLDCKILLWK